MANKHKGELSFVSDGKTYTLSFTINALCELDEALGIDNALSVLIANGNATLKQHRTMFFVALHHHHPEIENEKQAADLVTFGQMMKLLTEAIMLANPPDESNAPAPKDQGRPPRHPPNGGRAERGTGPAS